MQEGLSKPQIEQFIQDGFVRVDNAFSKDTARKAREILWRDLPCDPEDPATWTKPVIRLGTYTQEPFVQAANTKTLHKAFDQLVGPNQWLPCGSMGSFPVRFPSTEAPNDKGWHVDAGFPGSDPSNFFEWRINVNSKGRALLMLFLFSDTSELDAPTRIRVGSHLHVARLLEPAGDAGLSFMELAGSLQDLRSKDETVAVGEAGTVYLCHPFLVHAAQPHYGKVPKFMAQPPLLRRTDPVINESSLALVPVDESIRIGLTSQR